MGKLKSIKSTTNRIITKIEAGDYDYDQIEHMITSLVKNRDKEITRLIDKMRPRVFNLTESKIAGAIITTIKAHGPITKTWVGSAAKRIYAECIELQSQSSKQLSDWIVVDDCCAMRIIKASDPAVIANRIAFIEKTPRIRIRPFSKSEYHEQNNWRQGEKGMGGSDGNIPENGLYGFYQPSRDWCDEQLLKMGYELG